MEQHINGIKDTVLIVMTGLGSVLANMSGGWDVALQVLVYIMVADYLTGLVVAGVFKRSPKSESGALENRASFKGLVRKDGILTLVLVTVWLDKLTCAEYIRTAVCLFFVANEGLSILENLDLTGVPLPRFLKSMLEALREKADGSGEEKKA